MAKGVALVTGGGRRIGAQICSTLIDDGWYVLVHVRSSVEDAQRLLADASQQRNGEACGQVVIADLSTDEGLQSLIDQTHAILEGQKSVGLGVLIHNASIYNSKDYESVSLEELRLNNRIHIEVPFVLTQALTPSLKAASGCVIGMVDTSLHRAWKDLAHYTASKAG